MKGKILVQKEEDARPTLGEDEGTLVSASGDGSGELGGLCGTELDLVLLLNIPGPRLGTKCR